MSILIKGMEMPNTGLYLVSVDNTNGKDKPAVTVERMLFNHGGMRQFIGSFDVRPVVKCSECENAFSDELHQIVHCKRNGDTGYVWCKKEGCYRKEDFFCANGIKYNCEADTRNAYKPGSKEAWQSLEKAQEDFRKTAQVITEGMRGDWE